LGGFKLVEDYSDGEKQHRVWRFSKIAEGRYVGQRRADVIGFSWVKAIGVNQCTDENSIALQPRFASIPRRSAAARAAEGRIPETKS
jgi:hypothetical protein